MRGAEIGEVAVGIGRPDRFRAVKTGIADFLSPRKSAEGFMRRYDRITDRLDGKAAQLLTDLRPMAEKSAKAYGMSMLATKIMLGTQAIVGALILGGSAEGRKVFRFRQLVREPTAPIPPNPGREPTGDWGFPLILTAMTSHEKWDYLFRIMGQYTSTYPLRPIGDTQRAQFVKVLRKLLQIDDPSIKEREELVLFECDPYKRVRAMEAIFEAMYDRVHGVTPISVVTPQYKLDKRDFVLTILGLDSRVRPRNYKEV